MADFHSLVLAPHTQSHHHDFKLRHGPAGAITRLLIVALVGSIAAGCSIKQTAVDLVGDALSGGNGVYASDDDPDFIREAIPFGLKTYESLLGVSPEHKGLLLASASGFTAYAYLLQDKAARIDANDLTRARRLRARASKLYRRGRDYALRALAITYPGFTAELLRNPTSALAATTGDDVPFLYWAGASWAGALSTAKGDMGLIADLPIAGALVQRVLELDETFDRGAAHEFFVSYEASRPGGSIEKARSHYRRALELSGGVRASLHLALAESVTIREQDLVGFQELLDLAAAVDPDAVPALRLVNTIAKRRAERLRTHIPDMFLLANLEE
jgi:predicted anti-sigma-YlaC factor YlaD